MRGPINTIHKTDTQPGAGRKQPLSSQAGVSLPLLHSSTETSCVHVSHCSEPSPQARHLPCCFLKTISAKTCLGPCLFGCKQDSDMGQKQAGKEGQGGEEQATQP